MSKNDQPQRGNMNTVWLLAGGYLVYLGFKLVMEIIRGTAGSFIGSLIGFVLFFGVGGWLLYREWQAYQYAKKHVDDEETWSEEALNAALSGEKRPLPEAEEEEQDDE